jgi:hypothetical protein
MTAIVFYLGLLLVVPATGSDRDQAAAPLSREKVLGIGEKMYRTGILSSGEPMKAAAPDGAVVPGSTFACASCHTRSGLGIFEQGLRTLPVNGARLYLPRYPNFLILTPAERKKLLPEKFQVKPVRPAYTDSTLAAAIKEGIDPAGRTLSPIMPRYELGGPDLIILITYLKHLSSKPSPGVNDSIITFATVITDDVGKEERDAMLNQLEWCMKSHNNLGHNPGRMGVMLSMKEMRCCYREWTLTKWIIKGPPDTWQRQLEAHNKKRPVFALVGGISTLPWEPIHRFCETNKIPCFLPITDLPVISSSDYYTLYFSKGYYQEGEAAARYLEKTWDEAHPRNIIQVMGSGPEARALAAGFQNTWSELGHGFADTISIKETDSAAGTLPEKIGTNDTSTVVLLWTNDKSYSVVSSLAQMPRHPAIVFMSSTRLAGTIWNLPPAARAFTYLTWPFRDRKSVV